MAFPNTIRSSPEGVPVSQQWVPGVGWVVLKGSPNTTSDAAGTVSAAAMALDQSLILTGQLQNAQTTTNNGTPLTMNGMGSVLFEVIMAAGFTGTVNFEGAGPNGTYDPLWVNQMGTNTVALTVVGSTTTATHLYELANASGLQTVRARTSGVSAGNVTVNAYALPFVAGPRVVNANITSAGTLALESGGNLATIATRTPALGQATSVNSSPVVIASDQSNIPSTQKPSTSGGTLVYRAVAAASNNAASIKGSAGQVYGWEIYNAAAAARYVKLYNKATAPAPATDNGLLRVVIGIAAGQRAFYNSENGIAFSSGIGIAAVTGITDTDNVSTAANDLVFNVEYF